MIKKGFSLYQPFANLITYDLKHGETRFYKRAFRGELLICSSKKVMTLRECRMVMTPKQYERFNFFRVKLKHDIMSPIGMALSVVTVVDWREMNNKEDLETTFVDYVPGRFVAVLENIRPIVSFPIKGRQGLFNLTEAEQNQIRFGD